MTKHILVVDDDGDVRQVVADLLLHLGYRVSLAVGGESMRAFLESPDPVDVIVLDASVPGEPSESLAQHAKESGIRLVVISGNPEHMQHAVQHEDQLLRKPFRSDELERAIKAAVASDTFGQRPTDPA